MVNGYEYCIYKCKENIFQSKNLSSYFKLCTFKLCHDADFGHFKFIFSINLD